MRPMPRVPPFDRPASYDDLCRVSDIEVAEIVDGELHASPRPALRHAYTESTLMEVLGPPFGRGRGGPGGWIILIEPELHLGPDVLVPDLAGWRKSRMPVVPGTAHSTLAPDWICEILSPSTASFDRVKKLTVYARENVGHVWLVDPRVGALEVLALVAHRWTILATHAGDELVRAEPFDELAWQLSALWADADMTGG